MKGNCRAKDAWEDHPSRGVDSEGASRLLMSQMAEPRKDRIFYCLGGVHGKIWSKNDVQDEGEGKTDV